MKISIFPEEIIKMCLWDSYVYYVIGGSDKEAKKILEANEEIILSDRDALIIGLLKVIETDNLIHKFNNYVVELLTNKSMKQKKLQIRKKTFDTAIDKYLNKFPDYWEPEGKWSKSLNELVDYINDIKDKVDKLEVQEIVDKNLTVELYSSNSIKKLLKFNY